MKKQLFIQQNYKFYFFVKSFYPRGHREGSTLLSINQTGIYSLRILIGYWLLFIIVVIQFVKIGQNRISNIFTAFCYE